MSALWPVDPDRVALGTEAFALRLPARTSGPGAPVVLVHGFRGWALEWGPVAERLAATRDVWAVEVTCDPQASASGLQQVHAALDRVRELAGQPVDLVGISMGGFVTSSYAAARPGALRTLTLLAPALVPLQAAWRVPGVTRLIATQKALDTDERKWVQALGSATVDDFFEPDTAQHLAIPAAWRTELLDRYRLGVADGTGPGRCRARQDIVRDLMSVLRRRGGVEELLGRISVPVLWLHGDPDTRVPFAASEAVARRFPGFAFERLPDTGHLIHLERPELVADRVESRSAARA